MPRHPDWPVRFNEYVTAAVRRPFHIGEHDCCLFAAGMVEAITGDDPMAEFRGKYTTWAEARRVLREIGSGSLYNTLRSKFGNPLPGAFGRRGDVAYHEQSCGIVCGRHAMFFGENGYILVPISKVEKIFRVGG